MGKNKNLIDQESNLTQRIKKKYPKFSKSQKIIANYIISHYDKAAFMTAANLGEQVNISESTVVRFASTLGYSGYPKFQKALQELIKTKLTTVQRLELPNKQSPEEDIISSIIKSDIENIESTLNELDKEEFKKIVEIIKNARRIYVLGFRTSTVLSEFLGFYLNLVLDNVTVINYGISDIFEQLIRISNQDVIIGISFPRYSTKTSQVLDHAKEKGAQIIAITDSELSPLIDLCDYKLITKSNMISFVDSLVAPLSLINALIIHIAMGKKEEIINIFEDLENTWEKYEIYTSKENNKEI